MPEKADYRYTKLSAFFSIITENLCKKWPIYLNFEISIICCQYYLYTLCHYRKYNTAFMGLNAQSYTLWVNKKNIVGTGYSILD